MANPHNNLNAYGQNQKAHIAQTGSSRDTDSRALLACAWRLDDAKTKLVSDPKSKDFLLAYGDAIRHNQRLWTIFQVAISDPENPLPEHLKVILLNLARYVDRTSFRAVGKYTPDLADSLININRLVASGLSKEPPADAAPAPMQVMTQDAPTSLTTSA